MTRSEFAEIFSPLANRHPQTFTVNVSDLVYKIFFSVTMDQGRDVVSRLMLQSRMAPVDSDFRDMIRLVRDHGHSKNNVYSIRPNPVRSTIEPEKIPSLFKICRGEVPKTEIKEMEKLLWSVALSGVRCRLCLDEGLVHAMPRDDQHSGPFVFKCNCQSAMRIQENLPVWRSDFISRYKVILNGPEPEGAA
jgi:hypothetical protein